jgi:hypothetical protein
VRKEKRMPRMHPDISIVYMRTHLGGARAELRMLAATVRRNISVYAAQDPYRGEMRELAAAEIAAALDALERADRALAEAAQRT